MKFSKLHCRSFSIGSVIACLVFGQAHASGFALIENGASGQGNAYAGAAAHTVDASTVFFNPAGMMRLEGEQLSLAGHLILPKSSFQNQGSSLNAAAGGGALTGNDDDGGQTAIVPNFYWVKPLSDQSSFGIGMQSLFGLATKYDKNWVGRYHAVETDLITININPSIAYQVNSKLSIGGGVNLVYGDIVFSNAVDFGTICAGLPGGIGAGCAGIQSNDGFAELTGDNGSDPGYGFNFGLQYAVNDSTTLGVAYRSEVDLDFKGTADFTLPANAGIISAATGQFVDTPISAGVTLPASLALSSAHKSGKVTYLVDVTWTGWSSFDELRIDYENAAQADSVTTEDWNDTIRYSAGMDYQYSDSMILRTGVAYDETPIPSAERRTARVPGNDRTWLSFGLTYIMDDDLTIDVGYSHLFVDDSRINNTLETSSAALNSTLTGEYSGSVDILSVQLNWLY
jgi:long-chain fatty acid transport protein